MIFMTSFPAAMTAEHRRELVEAITSELMGPLRDGVVRMAQRFASEWDVDENLVSTWVAEILLEGATILRDWEAGEAEARGCSINDLSAAIEINGPSNYRRKAKLSKAFAQARSVAQNTNVTVPVRAGDWLIEITRISGESR